MKKNNQLFYIANVRMPTEKAHGVQITQMCESFSKVGFNTVLVVPMRFNKIKESADEYYGYKHNFEIVKVPVLDLVALGKIGFLLETVTFSVGSMFFCLFKKPAVIYGRDELPLLLCSFFFRDRVFWEAHMPRKGFITKWLLRRVKKIVVISNGLKDFFVAGGYAHNGILVAHDGVDLEKFKTIHNTQDFKKEFDISPTMPIVMYIGRIAKWKGVKTVLEASRKLPDIQFVVVGDGPDKEKLQAEYQNVIFTGQIPYRFLPSVQKNADILVIPNSKESIVSEKYTSPLKVFAHMASGVSIVASDLPSLREVLNESNAFFAYPDNPGSFAEQLSYVLHNKEEAKKRSSKAMCDVKKYDWSVRAQEIKEYMLQHTYEK